MEIRIDDYGHDNFQGNLEIWARPEQVDYANQIVATIRKRLSPEVHRAIEVVQFSFHLVGGWGGNPISPATVYTTDYLELRISAELNLLRVGIRGDKVKVSIRLALHGPDKKAVEQGGDIFMDGLREAVVKGHEARRDVVESLWAFIERMPQTSRRVKAD